MASQEEPSRKKRTSERQLTKDDRDEDEEVTEPQGTFTKASEDVMQKRKIVKARRPGAPPVSAPATVNPFAGVSLAPKAAAGEEATGKGDAASAKPEQPPAPEQEAPPVEEEVSPAVAVAVEPKAGEEEEGEEVNKGDRQEPAGGASTSGQASKEETKAPTTPGFGGFGAFAGSNAFGTGFAAGTAGGSAPSPFAFNFGTNTAGASGSFGSTPAFGSGISSFPSLSSVFKTNGAPVQLFGVGGSSAASNEAEPEEEGGASNLPQPAPVVQLSEVKVETGEEKETAAFAADATLYEFADGWKERGKGEVRVNVPEDASKRARLVMRAKGNLRLLLNAHIYPELKLSKMDGRGVSFAVVNHAGDVVMKTYAVRLKDVGTAGEFAAKVEELKGRKVEPAAGGEKEEAAGTSGGAAEGDAGAAGEQKRAGEEDEGKKEPVGEEAV